MNKQNSKILIRHAVIGALLHGSICIIDCGDPPTPAHGKVTLTRPGKTTVGSTATRVCNPGYELVGTANISCRVDGLWSASPVICFLRGMLIFMNRFNNQTILKRKSFATLTKMLFPSLEPNILLHDIVITKSNNLPSKQHVNQTSETYDCRSATKKM